MKKIVRYMQNQAVEYSGQHKSTVYLAPPGEEPQQRGQHSPHHGARAYRLHHVSSAAHSFPTYMSGTSGPNPIPKDLIKHQYASDNILQYYEAYVPPPNQRDPAAQKYWVIFIHGGYYRDPDCQAATFRRALASLVANPLYLHLRTCVAGYASINYRLSPHPDRPQNPDKIPKYEMNDAQHPNHINDVILGIAELQKKYGFGSNYLLAGHSVGATMAFQVALCQQRSWRPPSSLERKDRLSPEVDKPIDPPSAILGVNGIYSFPALHESFPTYVSMTSNAMGSNTKLYAAISPASYPASTYTSTWAPPPPSSSSSSSSPGRRRIIILASSPQDTLVDFKQVEVMLEALSEGKPSEEAPPERSASSASAFSMATTINPATSSNTLRRMTSSPGFEVQTLQLKGDHDHVWRTGEGLARAIGLVLVQLRRADREEQGSAAGAGGEEELNLDEA